MASTVQALPPWKALVPQLLPGPMWNPDVRSNGFILQVWEKEFRRIEADPRPFPKGIVAKPSLGHYCTCTDGRGAGYHAALGTSFRKRERPSYNLDVCVVCHRGVVIHL
eukprot:scaffold283_cov316-Pavlova_lutheri.AAC.22